MPWIFCGGGSHKRMGKHEKKGANEIEHSFLSSTPIHCIEMRNNVCSKNLSLKESWRWKKMVCEEVVWRKERK